MFTSLGHTVSLLKTSQFTLKCFPSAVRSPQRAGPRSNHGGSDGGRCLPSPLCPASGPLRGCPSNPALLVSINPELAPETELEWIPLFAKCPPSVLSTETADK